VLTTDVRGKPRVVACCQEASRRGVERGMALEQAKARAGDLVEHPWDAGRFARAALNVTGLLLEASPRVSWESGGVEESKEHGRAGAWERFRNEGVWWVDAAGLGDEQTLAKKLLALAKRANAGPVHVGVADAAIAAYAATFRSPIARAPRRLTTLVPSGRDAAFLSSYPLRLLALDDDLADTFAALGLTTLGALAALDSDEVEARFGPAGLAAHRLARGHDARGPSLPRDDTLPAVTCDLGAPVATSEPLLFVLRGALASFGAALRTKGLAAREITLALTLDDGSTAERTVRPARPTSHEQALFDHCRAALEDWSLPEPVTALALRAAETVSAAGEQGHLLKPRWADPSALEAAFDRIRGREGGDAVAVPEAREGHLPRDAGAWHPGVPGRATAIARDRDQERERRGRGRGRPNRPVPHLLPAAAATALRLLETPAAIRVRLGRSGLEAFRPEDTWHDVEAWSGPERLAPRWWRHDAPADTRDYYTARTRDGMLWQLFRAVKARAWFLEGWWD